MAEILSMNISDNPLTETTETVSKNQQTRTDCFSYNAKKHECNCLNELFCTKGSCNFFKTTEQYQEGLLLYPNTYTEARRLKRKRLKRAV